MATQRITKSEKDILKEDNVDAPPPPTVPGGGHAANASVDVPGSVVAKLLLFTFAMICAPLATYYVSVTILFKGNSTVAGGLAAVAANVVLISYVIAAIREDDSDQKREKKLQ